ncbi:SDR family oxidoreductase [Aureibacillus halotolerans]|uniref:NAD(P)-dependent dehydrogenase (Short-subunit alcohol dehydrogenase family) n=1 Tax=Aureibacillus halotolerans TaxID=1508390 RepID=A0A4R6TU21_9BACI|nr:SDR family oxidoreductase [Aureibacillus halotolerans]TDQ37208.1 NAD(P)-dependent dehydrogenase (short-subunit alcohol dehydrogenase family) [Aureibacillus halotolerans]
MTQHVVITGANRGLGLEFVRYYLAKGATVYACARSESDALLQLASPQLHVISLDVANDASVEKAFEEIAKLTSSLDIVINNAAARFPETVNSLEDVDFDVVQKAYNINSIGPLRVAKASVPLLEKGNTKVLTNISSEAGSIGTSGRGTEFDYCMSKAALNMQSVLLQNAVRGQGIRVLAIDPGWMHTDMGGAKAPKSPVDTAEKIGQIIEQRKGTTDEPLFVNTSGEQYPY